MSATTVTTVIHTPCAAQLGDVRVGLHGMASRVEAAISLYFSSSCSTGLSASLQANTNEIRALAAELIRHADATDAAREAALRGNGGAAC